MTAAMAKNGYLFGHTSLETVKMVKKWTFFMVLEVWILTRLVRVIDFFLQYGYGYRIRYDNRGLRLFLTLVNTVKYRTFCKVTVIYGYFGILLPTVMYGYVRLPRLSRL